jgi:hypothetical protein
MQIAWSGRAIQRTPILTPCIAVLIAFSRELDTGSREENASKKDNKKR